jgi:hypothetical protein
VAYQLSGRVLDRYGENCLFGGPPKWLPQRQRRKKLTFPALRNQLAGGGGR